MKYRFTAEARADVLEAAAFIGKRGRKKREEFAATVDHAVRSLVEHPHRGSPYELQTRRIQLAGYPYWMIYIAADGMIEIVAVSHHSRDPRHWHGRLTED